ncbi:HK97 family phage prohead protease [Mycoplasmopsis felis]|uniref:HK97 family phage prohead protease n=1 Tax=Mycoplasmopsis felis TaxID=33923 RepID=UPI002AFE6ACF|nr:HK97 family phage prohead protease [Mycoplasmopsis felis]WQQ04489.1 HK97 family phage prohead protease [Mycoplasmopsis felis]
MTNKTFIYQMKNKPLTQSEQEGRKIELTVELDSWSPIYDSRGIKFREKIALDCFDFDVEISKQFINSYLDHKVSIEHLLASTKNKTMTVQKINNKLIATIPVDENNLQIKKVADLISTGVIESNSFIFEPLEIEINEIENNNDLQTEIIYKKAKLISIDPVYEGFYPQYKCRVYDKNNIDTLEYLAQQKEQEMKAEELKDEVLKNTKEAQETETKTKEETNELQNSTNAEVEQLNARIEELEKRNKEIEKLKNELEEQAQERFKKVKEQNTMNQTVKSYTEFKELARSGKATNEDINALNNAMIDFLSEEDKYEIRKLHPVAFDKLEKRALDATTNEKGLAVIETVQMPGVLKDWTSLFPEFTELASKYNLTGLDTLVKNIYVPDNKEIGSIQEGADSTALGGKTFQVKFSPVRYSTFITQNNALTHGAELWSAQVENAKNSIRKSIRKKILKFYFYTCSSNSSNRWNIYWWSDTGSKIHHTNFKKI